MLCLDTDLGVLGSGGGGVKFLSVGAIGSTSDVRYATSDDGVLFGQSDYNASLKGGVGSGVFYNGNFYTPSNSLNVVLKLSSAGVPLSYITFIGSGAYTPKSVAINPNNGRMVVAASISGTKSVHYADPPYSSFTQVTGFSGNVNQVAWLNNVFAAIVEDSRGVYGEIWTSSDGSSWTQRLTTLNNADSVSGNAMLYGNGHYVIAFGGTDAGSKPYFYSSNGTSWSAITAANSLSSLGTTALKFGAYKSSNTTFYLYTPSTVAYTTNPSSNSSWTLTSLTSTGYDRMAISGDNIVMAKTSSLTTPLRYSSNGLTFSASTHPFTSPAQGGIACLVGV